MIKYNVVQKEGAADVNYTCARACKREPIKLGKENCTCVHALAIIRSGKRGREKIIYNLFFPKQPTFFLPKPDAHMRASGQKKEKRKSARIMRSCTPNSDKFGWYRFTQ